MPINLQLFGLPTKAQIKSVQNNSAENSVTENLSNPDFNFWVVGFSASKCLNAGIMPAVPFP